MPKTQSFRKMRVRANTLALIPVSVEGQAFFDKTKEGQIVWGKFTRPRNGAHHNKFFKLLNTVFENQDHYQSMEEILYLFKLRVGCGNWLKTKRYGMVFVPDSISFAKMDQTEFEAFYSKAIDFVCADIIPNMDEGDLRREIGELVGNVQSSEKSDTGE